ncbi:hypothetical protein ABT063_47990 [Streptomyces sp. NPDC002838]|uniref:hypothetical protein n=1 Tax=Streptomyces sp. NPDC002838 TaxID=3154436 RepID=UPI00331DD03E
MRLLVWPGPTYWGTVVVGSAGSGAGGGRRAITVEVTGGLEGDGEAAAVGIGAWLGLRRLDHGAAQNLVEGEQSPHLLLDAGRVV